MHGLALLLLLLIIFICKAGLSAIVRIIELSAKPLP